MKKLDLDKIVDYTATGLFVCLVLTLVALLAASVIKLIIYLF
jgi:type III secretory pathway component EscS